MYQKQEDLLHSLDASIRTIHDAVNNGRTVQEQLNAVMKSLKIQGGQDSLLVVAEQLLERFKDWEGQLIQPKQKTFQDVINFENKLSAEFVNLQMKADAADPRQPVALLKRFEELRKEWAGYEAELKELINRDLTNFNKMYRAAEIPLISFPKSN